MFRNIGQEKCGNDCTNAYFSRGFEYRFWLWSYSAQDDIDSASIVSNYLPEGDGHG